MKGFRVTTDDRNRNPGPGTNYQYIEPELREQYIVLPVIAVREELYFDLLSVFKLVFFVISVGKGLNRYYSLIMFFQPLVRTLPSNNSLPHQ